MEKSKEDAVLAPMPGPTIVELKAKVYDKVKLVEKTQIEIQQLHQKIAKMEEMHG